MENFNHNRCPSVVDEATAMLSVLIRRSTTAKQLGKTDASVCNDHKRGGAIVVNKLIE